MRSVRGRGRSALLIVPLLVLAACGANRERSLCSQYGDFQATVADIQELDPTSATSEDVVTIADDVLAELDQLQAASDGVYDAAISDLQASLTEFRQAAFALGTTDAESAQALLAEYRADVVVDYQVLTQRLDVACSN